MSGDFPFFECLNPGSYQPHGNPWGEEPTHGHQIPTLGAKNNTWTEHIWEFSWLPLILYVCYITELGRPIYCMSRPCKKFQ
jgi:hypothetical protein